MDIRKSLAQAIIISFFCTSAFSQNAAKLTGTDPVMDICFSRGGSLIAIAQGSGIKLCSMSDMNIVGKFDNGHTGDILSLDYSPDSSMIASGGKDSTVIIWSAGTGDILKKFNTQNSVVTAVRFSPVGQYLYTSGTDGNISMINFETGERVYRKSFIKKIITSFDISPDGKYMALVGSSGEVILCDALTGENETYLGRKMGWLRDIKFSNDGNLLIAAGDRGRVTRWKKNNNNFTHAGTEKKSGKWIYGIDIMDDNKTYAFCGFDKTVNVSMTELDYYFKTGSIVLKIKFKPHSGAFPVIAAATTKGVQFINVSSMDLRNN